VPPSRVLNLSNWKLQIPVASGQSNQPEEVEWPTLGGYHSQFFYVNGAGNGVIFWANVGGVIIPGSIFARTELREMTGNGTREASWSNTRETNTMTIREAITHLPTVRPAIVAGQIHDANTYVALIRLDGTRLWVKENNKSVGILDPDYRLGAIFTVKLTATDGRILVYYNDVLKVDFAQVCSSCYFKAGAYLQSDTSYGDNPDAYGEVVIYSLDVSHS
jgi:poly(beta-D-mannuronate) lyase